MIVALSKSRFVSVCLILVCLSHSDAFSQHSLQFDDGAGHYGILSATGLTGGLTTFTFPPSGGLLVTVPPPGTPALAWLSAGNTLVGTEKLGSVNNFDVVLVANDLEVARLVSGGGVEIRNSLDLIGTNTDLRFAGNSGVSGYTILSQGSGNTPEWAPAGGSISISNDFTGAGAFTSDVDDLLIGTAAAYYRIENASGSPINLTGLDASGSTDGRIVVLMNVSSNPIILKHQHPNSSAPNRFDLPGNADVILGPKGTIKLIYNGVSTAWQSFE